MILTELVSATNGSILMSCGNNLHGELGLGDQEKRNKFQEIKIPSGDIICGISCGDNNTLIKLNKGILMSSGKYVTRKFKTIKSNFFIIVTE